VHSRAEKNYETGLQRISRIGGAVGNTEMIIYELLHRAGTPEFKAMLPFIK
ncbi:MAG: isochorismatase, partial [Deltaproteobacteria bacterium]|nr:isochorismatase [Deltaproteobacteria bacterium]